MRVLEFPPVTTNTGSNSTATTDSSKATVMVKLQDVVKIYPNGSRALSGVNLEVKRGDFLFVTGSSGAGKSTLLKLLYGEERPSEGTVFVDGVNVSQLWGDRLSRLRRRIGIVFQDYKLIPRKTVAENVEFVLWAQGLSRKQVERRLTPTLKMVGLLHKAECFPDRLSGGEQQRVSLARAIVATPPLLLADEPTGNLDPDNAAQVMRIFQKLNSFGITVLVTTHDERWVRMANKPVIQLHEGCLSRVR